MKELIEADSSLKIISILIDMTSTSYIKDGTPICGKVSVLPSEVAEEDITDVPILDIDKIYKELNRAVKNIQVSNIFSDDILEYFDITNYSTTLGTVEKNDNGYNWNVEQIRFEDTAKLTLKSNKDIDSGLIFNELFTNKSQNVSYETYNESDTKQLEGTDSREGTDSTVIKICQGYDLKIKAVNESNTDVGVDGITVKVEGKNENKIESTDIVDIVENSTLIAKWVGTEYTITFDAGEGTTDIASKQVKNGQEYGELPDATRTGYTFIGWYNSENEKIENTTTSNSSTSSKNNTTGNASKNTTIKDNTVTSKNTLPKTGIEQYGKVAIVVVAIVSIFSYVLYKKTSKEVK